MLYSNDKFEKGTNHVHQLHLYTRTKPKKTYFIQTTSLERNKSCLPVVAKASVPLTPFPRKQHLAHNRKTYKTAALHSLIIVVITKKKTLHPFIILFHQPPTILAAGFCSSQLARRARAASSMEPRL